MKAKKKYIVQTPSGKNAFPGETFSTKYEAKQNKRWYILGSKSKADKEKAKKWKVVLKQSNKKNATAKQLAARKKFLLKTIEAKKVAKRDGITYKAAMKKVFKKKS